MVVDVGCLLFGSIVTFKDPNLENPKRIHKDGRSSNFYTFLFDEVQRPNRLSFFTISEIDEEDDDESESEFEYDSDDGDGNGASDDVDDDGNNDNEYGVSDDDDDDDSDAGDGFGEHSDGFSCDGNDDSYDDNNDDEACDKGGDNCNNG